MLETEWQDNTLYLQIVKEAGRKPLLRLPLHYPEWAGLTEEEKEEAYREEVMLIRRTTLRTKKDVLDLVLPRFLSHLKRLEEEGFFLRFGHDSESTSASYAKGLNKAKLYVKGEGGDLTLIGSVDKVFVGRNNKERFHRLVLRGVFLGYYSQDVDMIALVNGVLQGGFCEWEARAWRACDGFVDSL